MKNSHRIRSRRVKRSRTLSSRRRRPYLEALESRHLLATITVTSLEDTVEDDGAITLREAIQAANTNMAVDNSAAGEVAPIVDTIAFDTGLSGTITLTGGELLISETVSIVGPGTDTLTIDAAGNSRVMNIEASADDVSIAGLRIVGGRTTEDGASGGGILFDSGGELSISDSVISINETRGVAATGGGIFASIGDVTIARATVSSNTTLGDASHGGGIHVALGALTLSVVTVSGNRTDAAGSGDRSHGGGIYLGTDAIAAQTANAIINDSTITGNAGNTTNSGGGAIATLGSSIAIANSTISGNSTVGSNSNGGGAIYSYEASVQLSGVTVSDNHTTAGSLAYGGAIRAIGGSLTISGSTLSNNRTVGDQSFGGAVYALRTSTGITNSTVSGNRTEGGGANGGGIEGDATMVIANSTIVQNTNIATGGGILANGPLTLSNTIVANNIANFAEADINATGTGSSLVATFSFISVNDGTNLAASATPDSVTGNFVGTAANPIEPGLLELADNGGTTMTHAPADGSSVIDGGNPSFDDTALPDDQRGTGFARVEDGDEDGTPIVDIGAVEVFATATNTAPTISEIMDQMLNVNTASETISFTVGDAETQAEELTLSKLSSNTDLIPNENVVLVGEGASRTVIVTPVEDETGTAIITVNVIDAGGLMTAETFEVTVTADTAAPTITEFEDQAASTNVTIGPLSFMIGDIETAVDDLIVTVTSSNTTLVPALATNIIVEGSGTDRTLTIVPRTNQTGVTTIAVTVTDSGGAMTSVEFDLTIEDPMPTDPIVTVSPTGPGGTTDPDDLPSGIQPTSWANQRSSLREIVIDLGTSISSASASDLALTNLGLDPANDDETVITLRDEQVSLRADGLQVTITLDAGQLTDGLYRLDLLTGITGGDTFTITGDQTNRLFVLTGDWNGSGGVNIQDFATYAYWFGQSTPMAPEYVDLNNSGGINIQDFAGFATNFGSSIVFPTAGEQSEGAGEGELSSPVAPSDIRADLNQDGVVSADDAREVFAEIGRGGPSAIGFQYDSNQDGILNAADALFIINRIDAEDIIQELAAELVDDDTDEIEHDVIQGLF